MGQYLVRRRRQEGYKEGLALSARAKPRRDSIREEDAEAARLLDVCEGLWFQFVTFLASKELLISQIPSSRPVTPSNRSAFRIQTTAHRNPSLSFLGSSYHTHFRRSSSCTGCYWCADSEAMFRVPKNLLSISTHAHLGVTVSPTVRRCEKCTL
jgi:hypothetical protein